MGLFYRESGRGEAIVLLHGLYGCSDNWMTIAKSLGEKYRVIAVDLRNHGASPHFASHSYSDIVADLYELFESLHLTKAHILGHSMGGKCAMAFAADYPERILSLTVVDMAPGNYLESDFGKEQLAYNERLLQLLASLTLGKFSSRKDIEAELLKSMDDKFVISFVLKNLKRDSAGFEWKINIPVLQKYIPQIIGGIDYSFFESRLPIYSYPVLFVKGELSAYIQEENIVLIKKIYPEAQIEVIKGASHYLHAEKPLEFITCYLNFLSHANHFAG